MPPIRIALAFYLGVFLETVLVGIFIPLLIAMGYSQWKKVSMGRRFNRVMVFTTAFSGMSVLAAWIINVHKAMWAILSLPPGTNIDQQFLPPFGVDDLVQIGIFLFQVVVSDFVMVYRMYHIYDRSLLACILPSIATVALVPISCGIMDQFRKVETPGDFKIADRWMAAYYSVTLFSNVFISIAIGLRLWKVHRAAVEVGIAGKHSLVPRVMRVLVESAALWTLCISFNFISYLLKSNLKFAFRNLTGPVIGICFCLIAVRLGLATPEVREDYWGSSQQASRRTSGMLPVFNSHLSGLSVTLGRTKGESHVSVGESESGIMEPGVIKAISPVPRREASACSRGGMTYVVSD